MFDQALHVFLMGVSFVVGCIITIPRRKITEYIGGIFLLAAMIVASVALFLYSKGTTDLSSPTWYSTNRQIAAMVSGIALGIVYRLLFKNKELNKKD
jgi:uncharacterized membrane protein YraQ (UPF0718 family)